jgi:class 3 adenylate cyclase/predicted RNase H-like nuclease
MFRANDIDGELLGRLTNDDLKDIGVASFGHRKKLLEAIAELGGATTATPASPPVVPAQIPLAAAPPPISASVEAAGERRYLTVMFCDLVGSTGISAQLDAEEWRDLVGAYLDAASAAVTEMGGHVAKKLGDGLLALFGHPVAHENDAERAVRAALAIQRALGELNRKNEGSAKPELHARIGLETGPAVVDAAGEIYGDVANVAARVQALAEPGAVLVTARVQRQVAGLFVAEERGSHALKGVPEPVALFRLIRASGGGRRGGQRQLTPLVGRDDEMAMLLRRWERARQGDGQLVMIVGEPGLGKSRLIEEFHARLADTPHTWVEWSCSQLLQNTPLHPIAEWGRMRFGGADVVAERRLAELESSLAQVKLDPAENASLLAPLLDIPLPNDRAPALAPEELRRRQLAALTNWVMAGAKVQPIVLAFEDLHWADPTTLDVLRGIAERGALAPLFIVATTRPEFRPPWGMRSHHGTISLAPLDRAQVRDMVAELSARHALPRDVVEDVAARTGGVPLFVEEVTRLLLERGEHGGGIEAIPPTLQQSLMARLDRLGPAREVAQIGSVIGRGFSYGLLYDVAGMEDAALQAALEKLAEADIVLVQGLPPESDYRFKHALIQDAAYENLLKSRRQVLHRRVAEFLRDRFADTAAAEPEALAYHFTQAGMTEAAIEWWGKAGDQALRRSAFQEAIAHLGKAIEMADKSAGTTPQTTTPEVARARLQTSFGIALLAARGDCAPETTTAFARAQELAAAVDDPMERLSANYGLWVGYLSRGEVGPLRAIAEVVLRDIEGKPPSAEAAVAHRLAGTTEWYLGNFELARAHLEQTLAMFDPQRDHHLTYRFGRDTGVSAMVFMALTLWPLGETDRACRIGEEMLARAVASGHMLTTVYGHFQCALLHVARRDAATTAPLADAVVKLAREHGMALYSAYGEFLQPWARWHLGDREGGLDAMRRGVAACHGMGNLVYTTLLETALAEAEAEAGEIEAALASIDHTVALTERTGQRWNEADTHRARGEILLKRDASSAAPAEEAFVTAIAIAQQQKAKTFELRAALALAKLYQSTNRAADAHTALAPALEGFSPTPEFLEIEEAQTLLATLAETDEVKNADATRQRRLELQTAYGQALMWSKGFGAEETKVAFARAQELASGVDNAAERFDTHYGLWVNSLLRGELRPARDTAEIFLREANSAGRMTEAAVAYRCLGFTRYLQGEFTEAQANVEQALRTYDRERDREAKFRFGMEPGAAATVLLAHTNWLLGEIGRARELGEESVARALESRHVPTQSNTYYFKSLFEILRGDAGAARRAAETAVELSREHGIALNLAQGALSSSWARARLGDRETGVTELRQALTAYLSQGNKLFAPFFKGLLAELEAEGQGAEEALSRIDEALVLAVETGEHWTDAFLRRIRGEILLKRDPANTAPAEEAFLTAIAVAQQQKARSFELHAALSLAKLYQNTNRAADAHAALAPALEGFAPTPEFPEIMEAQTLLAALADTDEVKNAAAARQRRLKLQTSYGQAMMLSRGFGAEETRAAFNRAQALARGAENAAERFDTYYGLWVSSLLRGDLGLARKTAETFGREANSAARMTEAGVASRNLGMTCLFQGDLTEARIHLEEALRIYDPERDREAKFRFGTDPGAARGFLAHANWVLGEVGRARELIDEAVARAVESDHAPTLAYVYFMKAMFEIFRCDPEAVLSSSQALVDLSREHQMGLYLGWGLQCHGWAGARLGDREAGMTELRQALAAYLAQGNKLFAPFFQGALAEREVESQGADGTLSRIDEALVLANQTGEHWTDAFLHHIRGEILLKREAANTAPAEEAFLTAIDIAQQQKARSFELRAALSLARLWRDQGKRENARELLAQVYGWFTEGFDTLDLQEAKALLDELHT